MRTNRSSNGGTSTRVRHVGSAQQEWAREQKGSSQHERTGCDANHESPTGIRDDLRQQSDSQRGGADAG